MLVLSRRPGEKLVFPGFNAAVRVVAVKGNAVRLGIEAPPDVAVFREEVLDRLGLLAAANTPPARAADLREFRHGVRNRLSALTVGLALFQRQQQAGLAEAAGATLARIDQEVQAIRQHLDGLTDPPAARHAKARRALLVEDDRNERELLAGFLRVAGLDVATAGDGAEALDYLSTHDRPDAVLLDMGLPRCDGPTTVRTLRHSPTYAGLKIFAVSGHPPEDFDLDRGPAGIDRWFQKPLDPERLLAELHRELSAAA